MKIVVNDASIIIDLLKIDLLGEFFRLPYEFHTSDLVHGEITDKNRAHFKKYIDAEQIRIHDFQSCELKILHGINDEKKTLSMSDCSCLYLCQKLNAEILLTGDKKLRSTASEYHITVHGIIWILENLINHEIILPAEGAMKLEDLLEINPRLPESECRRWIKFWRLK